MLVTSEIIFKEAQKGQYAIPAPNFFDLDSLKNHIKVAEELNKPIILALAESHIGENITLEEAAYFGKKYAEEASVPVVLHLDHGMTPSIIKKAIDLGFSSVMIDASQDDFEANVSKTKDIVSYAHSKNVVVEAEIGHVGSGFNYENHETTDSKLTTPEDAKRFVELTNVDSLAISIGTAHGVYEGTPKINFERLEEIRDIINTPLVLHGGSSTGDKNLNKCSTNGIVKINIFSDLLHSAMDEIKTNRPKNYLDIKKFAVNGMEKCLKHYYYVFETKG